MDTLTTQSDEILITQSSDPIVTSSLAAPITITVSGFPSLVEVKGFLNITDATHDAFILRVMGSTINVIEKYLDRKLEYKEETETVLLTNCDKVSHLYRRVYLHRWPVTSVKSATNELGRSIDFQIDEEGLLCGEFHSGYKIIITYTGGLNPIPFDIISVFYEMINSLYAQKGTVASTAGELKSRSVPGVLSESYFQSGSGDSGASRSGMGVINPVNYAFILDPYKAWYC